jgi:hypothetical protein
MLEVLAVTGGGWALLIAATVAYIMVVWMILDIIIRSDFSVGLKIIWIVFGIFFSFATVLVYFLWVKRRNYST